jgi:uncharacterized membrane protein
VDTSYKILLFLHILSIVVAFAPASVYPLLARQYKGDSSALQRLAGFTAQNDRRVYAPALILAGLFGIMIIVTNDEIFEFSDTWVSLAFVVWFAMNGVLHGMITPNERKMGEGDADAARKVDMGGMIITVLFLVMLYLMIWKPGQ